MKNVFFTLSTFNLIASLLFDIHTDSGKTSDYGVYKKQRMLEIIDPYKDWKKSPTL